MNDYFLPLTLLLSLTAVASPGVAQSDPTESAACAASNIGSASGAAACFSVKLRSADTELAANEAKYASAVIAASTNPVSARRLVEAEALAWRAYRSAKCELYGEAEGGSEGWKAAMAASCEVHETTARTALLRTELRRK